MLPAKLNDRGGLLADLAAVNRSPKLAKAK
jgi:hypothetical protein